MNYLLIQDTIRDAIKADAQFALAAATTICSDDGTSKRFLENALANTGYSVSVWPPTRGDANRNEDAHVGVEAMSVVRLQINPQLLNTIRAANISNPSNPTVGNYINILVAAVIRAVLNIAPSPTGVRFALAPDAFDLVTFDEGLIAYHIRFTRLAVFGV